MTIDQPFKIKNILWDLDGTLFDTYPAITYAFNKILKDMGLPIAMNVVDGLVRQSLNHCVQGLAQRFKIEPEELRNRFEESYKTISPTNQPPYPGVQAVCEHICKTGGKNIILTHRGVASSRILLEEHNLAHLFSAIYSVEQGYPRKPDPAMVQAAMHDLDLSPKETLMIGDRMMDVQAGRAAGLSTCLFVQTQQEGLADYHCQSFDQLLAYLTLENS